MTPEAFFGHLVGLYRQARIPAFDAEGVTRARCRSVSGALEDLAAAYIATNCPGRFQIYVDQPLTVVGSGVRYPDLVLCERDSQAVCSFVDMKTDLGWKRDEIEAMSKRLNELATLTTAKLGPTPETRQPHAVIGQPGCHLVVAAWPNSGKLTPQEARAVAAGHGVEFYVLSDGKHPNHFSRGNVDTTDLVVRREDMRRLLTNVQQDGKRALESTAKPLRA